MRRKLPSTQALHCFEAAARHQSFTRAAQELNLTQGAVSRQVAALEDFLGVPLFRRTRHGMVLTAAGADYARRVRQRLDALERDAVDLMSRRGLGDSLTLAVVPTFAARWLIPRLPRLHARHPELLLHFETCTRPFLFGDSGVDAALWAGTVQQVQQWSGTDAVHLIDEEVLPVCSPALLARHGGEVAVRLGLPPAALARLPLLQQATRPDAWRQWFEAQGVDAPDAMAGPRYELFSMQAAAAMAGLGVALMPTLLIQDELASAALVVACPRPLRGQRAYYLVRPQGPLRTALAAFQQWLSEECRQTSAAAGPALP
jgi:DNA-binding transcriptional LysR family regulator